MYKSLKEICILEKGKTGIQKSKPGIYPLVVTAEDRLSCGDFQFDCNAVCIPLVSSAGHGKASIKRIHYQTGKFALGNILCAVISKNEDEILSEYIYVYLSVNKDEILVPLMKGAANVSMTVSSLSNVKIPIPSLAVQKEIINKYNIMLNRINDIVKVEEDSKSKLEILRNSLICNLFYGKNSSFVELSLQKKDYDQLMDYNNYNDPIYKNLEDFCRLDNGIKNMSNEKPYLDVKSLRGQSSYESRVNGFLINKDEYLILVDGENSGEIFIAPVDGIMGSTMKKLLIEKTVNINYILEFIKFHHSTFKNSKTGAAIPHLNKKLFKNILIPMPSLDEQKSIVSKIEALNKKYDNINELILSNINFSNMLLKTYIDNLVNDMEDNK